MRSALPMLVSILMLGSVLAEAGAPGGAPKELEETKGPQITSATIDAAAVGEHTLTVNGANFDASAGDFVLTVDGLGLTLLPSFPTPTQIVALLPRTFLPGSYVLMVTQEGGKQAAAFTLTIGASDLTCIDCVSAGEVAFPYAGSQTEGGPADRALRADEAGHADHATSADDADHATSADDALHTVDADTAQHAVGAQEAATARFAENADLLDGGDSSAFAPAAHAHPTFWQQNGSSVYYDGGRVGIGTAAPGNLLHVVGPARNAGLAVQSTFPGGDPSVTIFNPTTSWFLQTVGQRGDAFEITRAFGSEFHLARNGFLGLGTTGPVEKLHAVGNILATGSITPGSSRALKDDIAPLGDREAFEAFSALEPVTFTYKADASGDLQLGFIAEDVPELVAIPSRKGIAPMDLVALLTKVVQRQQAQIEELEQRLDRLEP